MVWLVLSLQYGQRTRALSAHPLSALKCLHQGSSDQVRSMGVRLESREPRVTLKNGIDLFDRMCRFRGQSALDIVVDRFNRDAPRFALRVALQLTRVDKLVQLLARDLDSPHRLV